MYWHFAVKVVKVAKNFMPESKKASVIIILLIQKRCLI